LKYKIEDPTSFPLSIEEDCFNDDIGNSSKAPACDLKGLKIEPARKNRDCFNGEFVASKENLLEVTTIINRNWSIAVEEDDSYIQIYPDSKTIHCCLEVFCSRRFAMIQE
jgi:hypothetical protein